MTEANHVVGGVNETRSIVVIRDRNPAAVQQPPRRMFGKRLVVEYVHARAERLPDSRHYVFNLDRVDDVSHARACRAFERGAQVTVVVRRVDGPTARALEDSGWNVIPAYGDTEHIGFRTVRRALRMASNGQRVVATGFLRNSTSLATTPAESHGSSFLRLVARMSVEAHAGVPVVAAVLAPHRTGSKWLRDLIGWTTGSEVRVFHEHAIPEPAGDWPAWPCLADALALESDRERQTQMRRTALYRVLMSARRRYIFATYRDPVERLISYFVKRHSRWLRSQLDDCGSSFSDRDAIQHRFEMWLPHQVAQHARWFRKTLLEPFGLDVRRLRPTDDGLLVTSHGPNTLAVVPIEGLTALRGSVEAELGRGSLAALDGNSAAEHGDGDVLAVFRRAVHFPPSVVAALRRIPEVAWLRAAAASHACGNRRRQAPADAGALPSAARTIGT